MHQSSFLAGSKLSISVMARGGLRSSGVTLVAGRSALAICGELVFSAEPRSERMLILLNRIQQLAFFAVFCVAWFDALSAGPSKLLATEEKQCWCSMVIGCPSRS